MAQIIVETLRIIVTTMGNSDVLCKKQQVFSSGMIMISHNSSGMIMHDLSQFQWNDQNIARFETVLIYWVKTNQKKPNMINLKSGF